ncbi:uncharacterized protein LOC127265857 [Andrographis paniculata]|uniref:uncharacterized protein LOC127265857 n=1 Tax=Andrographis paniculata TaxID=175694 RepID=UPI0021E72A9D|nr:uncharacterized protein LOC127265857 [Andrographis paniculata]
MAENFIMEGLIRCFDSYSIEQYLPHRVAMQFGIDQDIPGHVLRLNVDANIAWAGFTRPVKDSGSYIPGRLSEPQCTIRYADWWKKLNGGSKKELVSDASEAPNVQETKNVTVFGVKIEDDDFPPSPGFPPKGKGIVVKRKILGSSNAKIVDYYTPVSPGGSALKRRNESEKASDQVSGDCSHRRDDEMHRKDDSSFRDEDVAEPGASTRADAGEEAGDAWKMKMMEMIMDRNCRTPVEGSSLSDAELAERVEQRIGRMERLVASMKSEKRSDLPMRK